VNFTTSTIEFSVFAFTLGTALRSRLLLAATMRRFSLLTIVLQTQPSLRLFY
jgi:hypothetical protein